MIRMKGGVPEGLSEAEVNVWRELVAIRKVGLDHHAMTDHGKTIRALPAVQDQMSKADGALGPANAAVLVVQCAINEGISSPPHRVMLRQTLQIRCASPSGPDSPHFAKRTIKQLQDAAREELFWSKGSRSLVQKTYEECYVELATLLVRLRETPCKPDSAAEKDHFTNGITAVYQNIIDSLGLVDGFILLGGEDNPQLRGYLIRRLMGSLTIGQEKALGATDRQKFEYLIKAVLRAYYAPLKQRGMRPAGFKNPSAGLVDLWSGLPALAVENMLFAVGYQSRMATSNAMMLYSSRTGRDDYVDFFHAWANSIRILWQLIEFAESDGWSILDPPNKTAEVRV